MRARHDYLPFGEEIGGPHISLQGGRTPQQQYVSDSLRQQFTGQERDRESGLDYFKARAYASQQGRFTSVDPLLASGRPGNPQSFNRYAYALNNPLRFGDPLGFTDPLGLSAQGDRAARDGHQPEAQPPPHVDNNNLLVNADGSLYRLPGETVTVGKKSSARAAASSSGLSGGGGGGIVKAQYEEPEAVEPSEEDEGAGEAESREPQRFVEDDPLYGGGNSMMETISPINLIEEAIESVLNSQVDPEGIGRVVGESIFKQEHPMYKLTELITSQGLTQQQAVTAVESALNTLNLSVNKRLELTH